MTAALARYNAALKRLYRNALPEPGYTPPATWALLKKTTNFKGEDKSLPLQDGRQQSSHTFQAAQARAVGSTFGRFLLTRGQDYHVIQMTGEAMEAARDEGAVVNLLKRETRTGMKSMDHRLNRNIFRNEGMAIAQIQSGAGTDTLVLTNYLDMLNLNRGNFIVPSTDDGTGGAGVLGPPTEIIRVNRQPGVATIQAAAPWDPGFANGSFIFFDGDYGLGFFGAASWFPQNDPVPGDPLFFGQDRSVDPMRYAGQRFTAESSDGDLPTFFRRCFTNYGLQGGMGDVCIINPEMWRRLEQQLNPQVRYGKKLGQTSKGVMMWKGSSGNAVEVGFRSICIVGCNSDIHVIQDRDCPFNDGYIFDLEHFWWEGLGDAPRYLGYGGMGGVGDKGAWLRITDEDAVEGRIGARGQFACNSPGSCARLNIPDAANLW